MGVKQSIAKSVKQPETDAFVLLLQSMETSLSELLNNQNSRKITEELLADQTSIIHVTIDLLGHAVNSVQEKGELKKHLGDDRLRRKLLLTRLHANAVQHTLQRRYVRGVTVCTLC